MQFRLYSTVQCTAQDQRRHRGRVCGWHVGGERLKLADDRRDVPYQSLIKLWLAEKVAGEHG